MGVIKTSGAVDQINRGSIDSVYFKNIQITGGDLTLPSAIYGFDASAQVQNITFDNFRIGNNLINSALKMKLNTNSFVSNIVFKNTLTDSNRVESLNPIIYPTICKERLIVDGCVSANYNIIDMMGKTAQSGMVENKSITIASLNAGIYLISFNLNALSVLKRFVKQ